MPVEFRINAVMLHDFPCVTLETGSDKNDDHVTKHLHH